MANEKATSHQLVRQKHGNYIVVTRDTKIDKSYDDIDSGIPLSNGSDVISGRVTLKSGEYVDLSDRGVKTLLERANIDQKNVRKVIILRHPKVKHVEPPNQAKKTISTTNIKLEKTDEADTRIINEEKSIFKAKKVSILQSDRKQLSKRSPKSKIMSNTTDNAKQVSACKGSSSMSFPVSANSTVSRVTHKNTKTCTTVTAAETNASRDRNYGNNVTKSQSSAMDDSLTNINWLGTMGVNPNLEISMPANHSSKKRLPIKESPHQRPSYSYMSMIQFAISSTPDKRMTLQEIYNWIQTTFPYFSTAKSGWKNSIRHNLSLHDIFVREKPQESGKPSHWTLKQDPNDNLQMNRAFWPTSTVMTPQGVICSPVILPSNDVEKTKTGIKSKNPLILPRLTQSFAIIPIPMVVQTTAGSTQPLLSPVMPITTTTTTPTIPPRLLPATPSSTTQNSTSINTLIKPGKRKREGSKKGDTKRVRIAPKINTTPKGQSLKVESSMRSFSDSRNTSQFIMDVGCSLDSGMESQPSEAEQSMHQSVTKERTRPIILGNRHNKRGKKSKKVVKRETEQQENIDFDFSISEMFASIGDLDMPQMKALMTTPPKGTPNITSTPNKELMNLGFSPPVGFTPLKTLNNVDSGVDSPDARLALGFSPIRGVFTSPMRIFSGEGLGISPGNLADIDEIDGNMELPNLCGQPLVLTTPKRKSGDNIASINIGSLQELGLAGLTPDKAQHDYNQSLHKFLTEVNLSGYINEEDIAIGNLNWE